MSRDPLFADNEAEPVNLDAYCARIGYRGPREPSLATLRALIELHPAAIPFENIDVLLGRGVDITPAAVDAKLIVARRGGYCFEHNGLLRRVLSAIGFEVEGLAGRVRWTRPADAPPAARTHMALRVTVDGEHWLADVGFGSPVPTAPLRLATEEPQPTAHESFRVRAERGLSIVEVRRGNEWLALYALSPEPQLAIDYEVANWFTATNPHSPFFRNLMVGRVTPKARYALLDGRLTIRQASGPTESRQLDAEQLERALNGTFGLPVEPAWGPMIERAASSERTL